MASYKWERNPWTGEVFANVAPHVRLVRTGAEAPFLYSAEQWATGRNDTLRGPWCKSAAEALRHLPAPWRRAHEMDPEAALSSAIYSIFDRHFTGRFTDGVDRLAGYLEYRRRGGVEPAMTKDIRESWEAIVETPTPDSMDDVAARMLDVVRERCASNLLFEATGATVGDPPYDVLDTMERAFR